MKLLAVRGQNFGVFADPFFLRLDGQGLVSVVGQNRTDPGFDANGVGKSTILDAIRWGLFGETNARKETPTNESGLRGDEVINERVGKDCIVEVDFQTTDGKHFRVRRWRRAKPDAESRRGNGVDLLERVDDAWISVANLDKGNVQAEIDRRLGFDSQLFGQTVIRAQEDSFSFAQATPTQRFQILTQIEGLEELDAWDERFRARHRALMHEVALLHGELMGKEQTIAVLKEQLVREREQAERWEVDRQNRLDALLRRRTDVEARIAASTKAVNDIPHLEAQLAEVTARLDAIHAPISEPPQLAGWEDHLRTKRAEFAVARADLDRLRQRVQRAQSMKASTCDACGQEITPAHLSTHIAALTKELGSAEQRCATLASEVSYAEGVVKKAREDLAVLKQASDAARRQIDSERATILTALSAARAQLDMQQRLSDELRSIDLDIHATRTATNPMSTSTIAPRIESLEADLAATKDAQAKKASEAGLVEWWIRHLPSLKAWIFDSVVGEITREANRWLSVLTGGLCWVEVSATSTTKTGEVRDKISLRCFRWNADGTVVEREFRQWSGGEKRRIALAVDWALAARLSQRAKLSCSFLALDEVDRHLDAAGRVGLLSALDVLRREKETVVVVTHDPDMRAKPDVTWTVIKDATGSKVEVTGGRKDQGSV